MNDTVPTLSTAQLSYLVAITRHRTWAEAATSLSVTPSALSQGIAELERRTVGLQPGLTLLLDVDVAVGRARASGRDEGPDRIEREQDDFFQRVRNVFRQRAAAEPERFRVIDASQDQAGVAAQVVAAIDAYLSKEGGNG